MLYSLAAGTGFRASALAGLTAESFALDNEPPTVVLAARSAKNRKTQVQPLPPDLTQLLRDYLHDKAPGEPIWGGNWAQEGKGAEMLRIDLEAAGIPYAVDGPNGPLFADFHALRHSYISALGRAGVELRTAQILAGHSIPVLTARYSHRRLHDLAHAVEMLPSFLSDRTGQTETLRATGTGGKLVAQLVVPTCTPLHSHAPTCTEKGSEELKAACPNPLTDVSISTPPHPDASPCTSTPGGSRTSLKKDRKNRPFRGSAAQKPAHGRTRTGWKSSPGHFTGRHYRIAALRPEALPI
jgi:hypothetical protein